MKTKLTVMLIIISMGTIGAQDLKLTKRDKIIISAVGGSITAYGFLRKDLDQNMGRDNIIICTSGALFAGLSMIDRPKKRKMRRVHFTGCGFSVDLSSKPKKLKCQTKHEWY